MSGTKIRVRPVVIRPETSGWWRVWYNVKYAGTKVAMDILYYDKEEDVWRIGPKGNPTAFGNKYDNRYYHCYAVRQEEKRV